MDRLDKTDRAIIACLQYDGRMPFTTIAKRLGISQATVRNRVARMRDDGTLQVVGVVDPHLLGLRSTAIVGIVVEPARLDSVARSLAAFEEVSYLVMNAGTVDKILIAIERGLPFIYSNYGMAGASTPITPAEGAIFRRLQVHISTDELQHHHAALDPLRKWAGGLF
jgi:DNA-binding Lrp family transcriptional regulator